MRLLLGAVVLLALSLSANAQSRCSDYATMVETLNSKYTEFKRMAGILPENRLMELFIADDGSTFTVLMRFPSGQGCIITAGKYAYMTGKKPRHKPGKEM